MVARACEMRNMARHGAIVEELYHVANSMTCGDWNDPNEADNLLLHPSLLTEEQDELCRLKNVMNEIIGDGSTYP